MKHVYGDSRSFGVWTRSLRRGFDGGGFFVLHCGVVFHREEFVLGII